VASSINERMKQFFADLATDPVEERVVEYVIREVRNGRRLMEVMDDPFVRNRLSESKRADVLENTEIIDALEDEIHSAFQTPDIGFSH
jgi:hypothetical protein